MAHVARAWLRCVGADGGSAPQGFADQQLRWFAQVPPLAPYPSRTCALVFFTLRHGYAQHSANPNLRTCCFTCALLARNQPKLAHFLTLNLPALSRGAPSPTHVSAIALPCAFVYLFGLRAARPAGGRWLKLLHVGCAPVHACALFARHAHTPARTRR